MYKLRIQYASNLFLSSGNPVMFSSLIHPVAPYLALLGNIGQPNCKVTKQFFTDAEKQFKRIFWIPGALEYSSRHNNLIIPWQKRGDLYYKAIQDWDLQKTMFCQKFVYFLPDVSLTVLATPCWYMTMGEHNKLKLYTYDSKNQKNKKMNTLDFLHNYFDEITWIQTKAALSQTNNLLLTHAPIDPIILKNKNIVYHLYGTHCYENPIVRTGGHDPWTGINMAGNKHFSKEMFIEHSENLPKYC
jgi:hypothetical protein